MVARSAVVDILRPCFTRMSLIQKNKASVLIILLAFGREGGRREGNSNSPGELCDMARDVFDQHVSKQHLCHNCHGTTEYFWPG